MHDTLGMKSCSAQASLHTRPSVHDTTEVASTCAAVRSIIDMRGRTFGPQSQ
jgi:hypothetical protein